MMMDIVQEINSTQEADVEVMEVAVVEDAVDIVVAEAVDLDQNQDVNQRNLMRIY